MIILRAIAEVVVIGMLLAVTWEIFCQLLGLIGLIIIGLKKVRNGFVFSFVFLICMIFLPTENIKEYEKER